MPDLLEEAKWLSEIEELEARLTNETWTKADVRRLIEAHELLLAERAELVERLEQAKKTLERIRERAGNTGCQACWIEATDALAQQREVEGG